MAIPRAQVPQNVKKSLFGRAKYELRQYLGEKTLDTTPPEHQDHLANLMAEAEEEKFTSPDPAMYGSKVEHARRAVQDAVQMAAMKQVQDFGRIVGVDPAPNTPPTPTPTPTPLSSTRNVDGTISLKALAAKALRRNSFWMISPRWPSMITLRNADETSPYWHRKTLQETEALMKGIQLSQNQLSQSPGGLTQVTGTQMAGGLSGGGSPPKTGSSPNLFQQPSGNGGVEPGVLKALKRIITTEKFKEDVGTLNDSQIGIIARTVVRAIRETKDDIFEKVDVNPKHHRENFTKVIDQIMRQL